MIDLGRTAHPLDISEYEIAVPPFPSLEQWSFRQEENIGEQQLLVCRECFESRARSFTLNHTEQETTKLHRHAKTVAPIISGSTNPTIKTAEITSTHLTVQQSKTWRLFHVTDTLLVAVLWHSKPLDFNGFFRIHFRPFSLSYSLFVLPPTCSDRGRGGKLDGKFRKHFR